MGGTLAVTIRDHDGVVHRTARWTNPTPFFIHNLRFIEKDRAYLRDYLNTWYKMREDWLKYGDTPQNPSPMSACYTTDESMVLAPQGYGLLVIDYVTSVVLHRQNYTTYGNLFFIGQHQELEERAYAATLFDAGKLHNIKTIDWRTREEVPLIYTNGAEFITQTYRYGLEVTANIDMSPWQITSLKDTCEAWLVFRQTCDNLIGLTDQDKAVWDEWFRERVE